MHRLSPALGMLILGCALLTAVTSPAVSGDKDESSKRFAGKFVNILRKSAPDSATSLEKVHIAKLEERTFLVGTGVDLPDNWQKGRSVWIAIDDIGEMTIFDSLEDLKKAMSESASTEAPPAKT